MFYRGSTPEEDRSSCPLPGRCEPLRNGHRGVPHAETELVIERRVRLCQAEKIEHFTEFQLHGPVAGL